MSAAFESADLLLRLYDLRREATMREARQWFVTFNPDSADDMIAAVRGEHSAHFRMVTSFWDMAASFVNNGAIEEKMFNDANGEHVFVMAKLVPFLAEYRERTGQAQFLKQLETLTHRMPNARERLASVRERLKAMTAAQQDPAPASR